MNFKVGDCIRIKSRQEMIRDGAREIIYNQTLKIIELTFPSKDNENQVDSCTFVADMDKYCDNVYKIRSIEEPLFTGDHPMITLEETTDPRWTFIEPMFTLENKKKLPSYGYPFREELV